MTIDELVNKIDSEPAKQEVQAEQTSIVETPPETNKEKDMLPCGQEFEEYCESRKRK